MALPFEDKEFERIVRSTYGPLLLFARQWDQGLAEDAVQTALLKLSQNLRSGDCPENISAWLFKVVRNELKYRLRQHKSGLKHAETYALSRKPWFTSAPEVKLDAETVAVKLAELPFEQREAIVAKIWGELSFEEIAELLETSRSTAHRRYTEGIETLRKKLHR